MKELCEELFCYVFDWIENNHNSHRHIFECDAPDSVFLHLFKHLENDANNIQLLLSGKNELFLRYFKENLQKIVKNQLPMFDLKE